MLSDAASAALRNIAHHIELAGKFAEGLTEQGFLADARSFYAVTRCLEIISEASRRLPDDLKSRHPSIAWKNIAAAGNFYRHDYEDVDPRQVWETVRHALPPLRAVIACELATDRARCFAARPDFRT